MVEIIVASIFLFSLVFVGTMLYRKIPELVNLSKQGSTGFKKHHHWIALENRIKQFFIVFEKQIWLHRLLSFARVMVLKVQVVIDNSLHNIRKKATKVHKETKIKK